MIRWMLDEDGWLIGVNFHDGAVVASYPWDHYTVIMTIMVIAHYKMIMMILHYTVIMTIMVIARYTVMNDHGYCLLYGDGRSW